MQWPVVEIRQAVLEDDFTGLSLTAEPRWLVVSRLGEDILIRALSSEAAHFTQSLIDNRNQVDQMDQDRVEVLAQHLLSGCFQENPA